MDLSIISVIFFLSCTIRLINSYITDFNYEKMHRFGQGRRAIINYRRLNPNANFGYDNNEHPVPLPTPQPKLIIESPYHSIYQGKRKPGDFRVYNNGFENAPPEYGKASENRYFCEAILNCIINFISIRTNGGIPIILRGGVGYRHFYVIARSRSEKFNGSVQVFCTRNIDKNLRRYQYEEVGNQGQLDPEHTDIQN